jgi:hypothetical protein
VIPPAGSVLGIDVGYSPKRRSSAVCRLAWTESRTAWSLDRFRFNASDLTRAIVAVAGGQRVLAAGVDGPLAPGFQPIDHYRNAERLLTRRLGARIGKPGASNAPSGRLLNQAANACVRAVLAHADLADATHAVRIDVKAVFETFPTGFLGVMLPDPAILATKRNDRSDRFYQHLAADGTLGRLLARCLPGRAAAGPWSGVTNHDDRAALVCALAALCVASGDYTAVGDDHGWIILPPAALTQPWARDDLLRNAATAGRYHQTTGAACVRPGASLRP